MTSFFEEIGSIQDAIKSLNSNIQQISDLHARSLTTLSDDAQHTQIANQLTNLQGETSRLTNNLKNRIKLLESSTSRLPPSPDTNVRRTQEGAVKKRFMEAIQNYTQVEKVSRDKMKQRMERQFKIVKPEATEEEVRQVVDGDDMNNGQIFSQAVLSSTRYGDARAAYREVQDRHTDIKKIEKTITELAQLFTEMSILTEEQNDKIVQIDTTAGNVEQDVSQAEKQLGQGVVSAKKARRKRWICFGIIVVILAVVAVVVAVEVTNHNKK